MPGAVTLDSENRLIRVQFGSDSKVDNWKSALVEVRQLSEETGICRVLVDVREQTDLASTMDLFDFATSLPRSIAFAVLCELHHEDHHFIETVAKNRGILVQDFDSEEKAIEWLMNWPNKSIESDKE
jgi:hypothetical protein